VTLPALSNATFGWRFYWLTWVNPLIARRGANWDHNAVSQQNDPGGRMTDHSPLSAEEQRLLQHLRSHRRLHREERQPALEALPATNLTWGQRLADRVAATVGSWRFILVQSALIAGWIAWNTQSGSHAWDPYPFILLNLVLSFQAAYTAPAIMMSQNRQSEVDRLRSTNDYEINVKAELEIELLHQKIDMMREQDIRKLEEALLNVCRFLERQVDLTKPQ
jgi:uncharacterized membrane protein